MGVANQCDEKSEHNDYYDQCLACEIEKLYELIALKDGLLEKLGHVHEWQRRRDGRWCDCGVTEFGEFSKSGDFSK